MKSQMGSLVLEQLQIIVSVVSPIVIYVVHNFQSTQIAAETLFHHQSVLVHVSF